MARSMHQLALVGIEHAVLLQEHQEAEAFAVEAVQSRLPRTPAPGRSARGFGERRALVGQLFEPVEGLADFGGAEAGLDQAVLEGVAIADGVGVVVEVVFEQVQQDVEYGFFHRPLACAERDAPRESVRNGGCNDHVRQ